MTQAVLLSIVLILMAQLLALVCAVAEAMLVKKRPRLALLLFAGMWPAAIIGGYGMGSAAGETGLLWFVFLIGSTFALLGAAAGFAAGIWQSMRSRHEKTNSAL